MSKKTNLELRKRADKWAQDNVHPEVLEDMLRFVERKRGLKITVEKAQSC